MNKKLKQLTKHADEFRKYQRRLETLDNNTSVHNKVKGKRDEHFIRLFSLIDSVKEGLDNEEKNKKSL